MVPRNRSAPPYGIVPVVAYDDVRAAVRAVADVSPEESGGVGVSPWQI